MVISIPVDRLHGGLDQAQPGAYNVVPGKVTLVWSCATWMRARSGSVRADPQERRTRSVA